MGKDVRESHHRKSRGKYEGPNTMDKRGVEVGLPLKKRRCCHWSSTYLHAAERANTATAHTS